MTAGIVLERAEDRLRKDQRAYAKKLLNLISTQIRHEYPAAAQLNVYVDRTDGLVLVREARCAQGSIVRWDAGGIVVARVTDDSVEDVSSLFRRALEVHPGLLEDLLVPGGDAGGWDLDLERCR